MFIKKNIENNNSICCLINEHDLNQLMSIYNYSISKKKYPQPIIMVEYNR